MSKAPKTSAEADIARPIQGARAYWVLLALVLGLALGALAAQGGDGFREPALQVSGLVGGLWLNGLKMTVIPLVVALLVVSVNVHPESPKTKLNTKKTLININLSL